MHSCCFALIRELPADPEPNTPSLNRDNNRPTTATATDPASSTSKNDVKSLVNAGEESGNVTNGVGNSNSSGGRGSNFSGEPDSAPESERENEKRETDVHGQVSNITTDLRPAGDRAEVSSSSSNNTDTDHKGNNKNNIDGGEPRAPGRGQQGQVGELDDTVVRAGSDGSASAPAGSGSDDDWDLPVWTRRLSTTLWPETPNSHLQEPKAKPGDPWDDRVAIHTGKGNPALDRAWVSETRVKRFEVTVVNVGDSRAIVVDEKGRVFPMTIDHKPNTPSEAKRILEAGGHVMYNRVDGELAMSRAFGDFPYKLDPNRSPLDQKVIALPDVSRKIVTSNDQLLVCCDGFFETLSTLEVGQYMHRNRGSDPSAVMAGLCQYSLDKGSKDNMSGTIVYFKSGAQVTPARRYQWGPLSRNAQFIKAYQQDAQRHGVPEAEVRAALEDSSGCTLS